MIDTPAVLALSLSSRFDEKEDYGRLWKIARMTAHHRKTDRMTVVRATMLPRVVSTNADSSDTMSENIPVETAQIVHHRLTHFRACRDHANGDIGHDHVERQFEEEAEPCCHFDRGDGPVRRPAQRSSHIVNKKTSVGRSSRNQAHLQALPAASLPTYCASKY